MTPILKNPKVNDSKTEFILIETRQQLAKVDIKGLAMADATISPVTAIQNLGSWFDENKMCKTLSFHLYNIRCIRKYLSKDSTRIRVHAFVTAHIDYCNGLVVWFTSCTSQVATYSEQCCPTCLFPSSVLSYNFYFVFLALLTCLFQN